MLHHCTRPVAWHCPGIGSCLGPLLGYTLVGHGGCQVLCRVHADSQDWTYAEWQLACCVLLGSNAVNACTYVRKPYKWLQDVHSRHDACFRCCSCLSLRSCPASLLQGRCLSCPGHWHSGGCIFDSPRQSSSPQTLGDLSAAWGPKLSSHPPQSSPTPTGKRWLPSQQHVLHVGPEQGRIACMCITTCY